MNGILYLIAVVLIVGWLLGVFWYAAGNLIHIFLVLAIVSLIIGYMRKDAAD